MCIIGAIVEESNGASEDQTRLLNYIFDDNDDTDDEEEDDYDDHGDNDDD